MSQDISGKYDELPPPEGSAGDWILSDALEKHKHTGKQFPVSSFNHIAREAIDVEKSKNFYCDILGFRPIPRPPLGVEGYWLFGNNLMLHLIQTKNVEDREAIKAARIKDFSHRLPGVDHIAFLTTNLQAIREILDSEEAYYKYAEPAKDVTGIKQIFLFDPDGNVVEISNCAPPVGEISCARNRGGTPKSGQPLTPTATHDSSSISYTTLPSPPRAPSGDDFEHNNNWETSSSIPSLSSGDD
jgi:catechol 2,3-dioxygenase-like lactoylglutathione lyase family enzyme